MTPVRIFGGISLVALFAVPILVLPDTETRVEQLIADGELRGALTALEQVEPTTVQSERTVASAVDLNLSLGRVDEAKALLEPLLAERPDLDWAHERLAEIVITTGSLEERLELVAERFGRTPTEADFNFLVGHAKLSGDTEAEYVWLQRGVSANLANTIQQERLGLLEASRGSYEAAIEILSAIVAAPETSDPARLTLFRLLTESGRGQEALEIATRTGLDLSDRSSRDLYASQIIGLGNNGLDAIIVARRISEQATRRER